jgi:hypothetical protein
MTPGTILKDPTRPFRFMVLYGLLKDTKDRFPVTLLSTEPFAIENVFTQVRSESHTYYLVPGAGWLTEEFLKTLEPVGTATNDESTKIISVDPVVIEQLAEALKKEKDN